jgi:hypothetical protein
MLGHRSAARSTIVRPAALSCDTVPSIPQEVSLFHAEEQRWTSFRSLSLRARSGSARVGINSLTQELVDGSSE